MWTSELHGAVAHASQDQIIGKLECAAGQGGGGHRFQIRNYAKSGSVLTFCTFGLPIVTRRDVDQPSGRLSQRPDRLPLVAMSQYVLDHHLEGEIKALNGESDLEVATRR
jgi:hypothetical protein